MSSVKKAIIIALVILCALATKYYIFSEIPPEHIQFYEQKIKEFQQDIFELKKNKPSKIVNPIGAKKADKKIQRKRDLILTFRIMMEDELFESQIREREIIRKKIAKLKEILKQKKLILKERKFMEK